MNSTLMKKCINMLANCSADSFNSSREVVPDMTKTGRSNVVSLYETGLVSRDTYLTVDSVLEKAVYPLLVTAFVLNVFNSMVYNHSSMKGPSCTYLLALSVDELLYVCVSLIKPIVGSVYGAKAEESALFLGMGLYVSSFVTTSLRRVMFSLTALVCLERFLAITFPLKSRKFRHICSPVVCILSMFVLVFSFHFPFVFRYEIFQTTASDSNETIYTYGPTNVFTENKNSFIALSLFNKIVFVYVLVCCCMVSNLCMFCALRKQSKRRKGLRGGISDQRLERREGKVTLTILTSTFLFVLLSLPTVTDSLVFTILPNEYGFLSRQRYLYLMMQSISYVCSLLSLSTDFLFYMLLSSNFRSTFLVVVCCRERRGLPTGRRGHESVSIDRNPTQISSVSGIEDNAM